MLNRKRSSRTEYEPAIWILYWSPSLKVSSLIWSNVGIVFDFIVIWLVLINQTHLDEASLDKNRTLIILLAQSYKTAVWVWLFYSFHDQIFGEKQFILSWKFEILTCHNLADDRDLKLECYIFFFITDIFTWVSVQ